MFFFGNSHFQLHLRINKQTNKVNTNMSNILFSVVVVVVVGFLCIRRR